jgi:hypothetical protein
MKSFSILRTNVGLTTNVKIVIDSSYNLSLDSIDSDYNLSQDRYKNFKFNIGLSRVDGGDSFTSIWSSSIDGGSSGTVATVNINCGNAI